ncbi:unnamed protein product [Mytilus coruscus]|uniref:Uncharacterized protein n=1 Tax=Mytilus coruscus TaxID=42192 RepID=A0A6J8CJE4_MYTCO|nr:unnamed protein product [Mytilus coruscus]
MAHPTANHTHISGLHDRVQHPQPHIYPQHGPPVRQFPFSHSESQTRQPRSHVNNSQQQSHSQFSQNKPSGVPTNSRLMDFSSQHKLSDHQTNQVRHNVHQKSEKLCATEQFPTNERLGKSGQPTVGLSTTCRPALLPTPTIGNKTLLQSSSNTKNLDTNHNS